METSLISAFLEELVYESDVKCHISDVFEHLEDRGILCDTSIKSFIWSTIKSHPDVYFVDPESTFNHWNFIDENAIPGAWVDGEQNDESWGFNHLRLLSSVPLRKTVLNLWEHPEISDVPIRMRIISGVASKRYQGCWQFELTRLLDVDPKSMFQHLKAFYKYDCIVRFNLPLPQRLKRTGNISGSGVLWLSRFFDVRHIPRDVLQMIYTQQSLPLVRKIVELLKSVPNHIVLETDLRAFCLSFFVQPGHTKLLCSMKTAARYYQRIRHDLVTNQQVIRVKAWCPQTGKFESSLALYGSIVSSQSSCPSALDINQQEMNRHRKSQLQRCFPPMQQLENEQVLQSVKMQDRQHPEIEREFEEDEEDLARLQAVKVEVSAINPKDYVVYEGYPMADDGYHQSGTSNKNDLKESQLLDDKANNEESTMSRIRGYSVYELPATQQILLFIRASGACGALSTHLATLIGTPPKKIIRQLSGLESQGLIQRRAQRIGKHFTYKYYDPLYTVETIAKAALKKQPNRSPETCINNVETVQVTLPEESIPLTPSIIAIRNRNQIRTDQFTIRLQLVKQWIKEFRACGLPDLSRRFASLEKSKGPDRKTVQRLLDEAQSEEPLIKKTTLGKGRMRGQPVSIYYWSELISEVDAKDLVDRTITARRSENCREAVKRNLDVMSLLKSNKRSSSPEGLREGVNRDNNLLISSTLTGAEDGSDAPYIATTDIKELSLMENNEQKIAALSEMTKKIERYSTSGNPVARYCGDSQIILADVHVEKRPDACVSMATQSLIFSQKVLAHYGFVFPIMIRLKIFHRHLIDLIAAAKEAGASYAVGSNDCSNRTSLTTVGTFSWSNNMNGLTEGFIINRMPIETFLRTIGCGYQHSLVDAYLRSSSDHTATMDVLPLEVYEALTQPHARVRSGRPGLQNSRNAIISVRRLLEKLFIMRLVEREPVGDPDTFDPSLAVNTASPSAIVPGVKPMVWCPISTIIFEAFTDSITEAPEIVGIFDVFDPVQFEAYWRCFKGEADRWMHFRGPDGNVPNISSLKRNPSHRRYKKFGYDWVAAEGVKKAESPYVVDEFKSKSFSSELLKNSVHRIQRKLRRTEENDFELSEQPIEELVKPIPNQAKQTLLLPMNMPLPQAFPKKNWKAQILVSAKIRAELEKFAIQLLERFKTLKPHNDVTYNQQEDNEEANVAATVAVISAAQDIDQRQHQQVGLYNRHTTTCSQPSASSAQTVFNPQTPDIQELALRLRIPTDAVIRFLLRFLHTSHLSHCLSTEKSPLVIHTTRDLRYRCHLCGSMYAQKPAIIQHYRGVHHQDLPESQTLYMLPGEYQKRLENISNQSSLKDTRKRRRRRSCTTSLSSSSLRCEEETTGILSQHVDYQYLSEQLGSLPIQQDTSKTITAVGNMYTHIAELNLKRTEDLVDAVAARRLVNQLRRDDEFLFLGIAVVAERLLLSSMENEDSEKQGSASIERFSNDPLALFSSRNEITRNRRVWVFRTDYQNTIPSAGHRIWNLFYKLCPVHLRVPQSRCRFLFEAILERSHASRNARIFGNYRRLGGNELHSHLCRLEIPCFSNIIKNVSEADGLATITGSCASRDRRIRLILWRNILKTIVLTPVLCYRPYWADRMARELRDSEIRTIWADWNRKGWVVQTKSIGSERRGELQSAFEAKTVRKYCISHNARVALFGKTKDLLFANEVANEFSKFVDPKPGAIFSKTVDCIKSSERMMTSLDSTPETGAFNISGSDFSGSGVSANLPNKREHKVVPEPVTGPYVAALLDEFSRGSVRLQPEWEDNPQFYEINEEQTDEKIFNLLLGDMSTTEMSKDQKQKQVGNRCHIQGDALAGHINKQNSDSDSDTDEVGERKESSNEDAQLQLLMMLLEDNNAKENKKRQRRESSQLGSGDDRKSEEEDERETSDGMAVGYVDKEECDRRKKNANNQIVDSLKSSKRHGAQQLKELSTPLRRELDDFDPSLEGENRVLARAIEGGVEKHILELTGNIANIGSIRYWEREGACNSINEQLAPCSSSVQKMNKHFRREVKELSRRQYPFRLFLDGHQLRHNLGCPHEGDAPDPQLFSNRYVEHLLKETEKHVPRRRLPWCTQKDNQPIDVSCIPIYSDDKPKEWDWDLPVVSSETQIESILSPSRKRRRVYQPSLSRINESFPNSPVIPKHSITSFNNSSTLKRVIANVLLDYVKRAKSSTLSNKGEVINSPQVITPEENSSSLVEKCWPWKSSSIYHMLVVSDHIAKALKTNETTKDSYIANALTQLIEGLLGIMDSVTNKESNVSKTKKYFTVLSTCSNIFFALSRVLNDLLLEIDDNHEEKIFNTERKVVTTTESKSKKIRAMDALLWIMDTILEKQELGIREEDLESRFMKVWKDGWTLQQSSWKSHSTQEESNESVAFRDGSTSCSYKEVPSDVFAPTLFYKLLWVLETLRLVIRFPYMDCWRYVSGNEAEPYSVIKRSITGYGVITKETGNSMINTQRIQKQTSSAESGARATLQQLDSSRREISPGMCNHTNSEQFCLNQSLLSGSDDYNCPSIIPIRTWVLWGKPVELQWTTLAPEPLELHENKFKDTHLVSEKPEEFIQSLSLRSVLILLLRLILTPTVSILTYFAHDMHQSRAKAKFPLPLPPVVIPSCSWVQLDGALNKTLISLVSARSWTLLQDVPGCSARSVYQQLALLDFCEVEFLLKCLTEESVLASLTSLVLNNVRSDNAKASRKKVDNLYFREIFARLFSSESSRSQ